MLAARGHASQAAPLRSADGGSQFDEPEVGVTGVVAVSDHAGDGEPPVGHPVLALQRRPRQ